jgi:hypothetical protein
LTSLNNKNIYFTAIRGNNIFVSTFGLLHNEIYFSSDNGEHWQVTNWISGIHVNVLSMNGIYVYAGTSFHGLYFSPDNGQNWIQTSLNNVTINSISVNETKIYVGTDFNGVYFSLDNGQNWTHASLTYNWIRALAVFNSNVFAGTYDSGIYYSSDYGLNWVHKNEGLDNLRIKSLVITNGYIYAGTYGSSVWKRSLSDIIGINTIGFQIPLNFSLSQNYPNPFNPTTKIKFDIPPDSRLRGNDNVTLKIYDALGREITTLVNEQLKPGTYEIEWDGSNYPSGVYFYKLLTADNSETRKMVLIK